MVKVNGEWKEIDGMLLAKYLVEAGYLVERLAVECNGEIVPRAKYAAKVLQEGDVLEIVSFVGGG